MRKKRYKTKKGTLKKIILWTTAFFVTIAFMVTSQNKEKLYLSDSSTKIDLNFAINKMMESAFPSVVAMNKIEERKKESKKIGVGIDLNILGITDSVNNNTSQSAISDTAIVTNNNQIPPPIANPKISNTKPQSINLDFSKPTVIIYHTHATESYRPKTDGNFHSLEEVATVREVGNVMTKELEALGIKVIHNKTIHDNPSYNQSYSRSHATITNLMASNKTAPIIIDLHRDAAASQNGKPLLVKIDGKDVAQFSLVVGQGNTNLKELTVFANYISEKANTMYPGIARGIIEKPYKFNEDVSNYSILLEVGNNENTIEQVNLTARYFARIMAATLNDIKK